MTLIDSTRLQARLIDQGEWSALTAATFVQAHRPRLRITELMYHPADPAQGDAADIEFLEVANLGQQSLELGGFRLTGGIQFDFPDATLDPAEHVVVVSNQAEYLAHYGSDARVVGEYNGQLSNGGESIRLAAPLGETVLDFQYDDGWYPVTDGDGYSLVIVDPFGRSGRMESQIELAPQRLARRIPRLGRSGGRHRHRSAGGRYREWAGQGRLERRRPSRRR